MKIKSIKLISLILSVLMIMTVFSVVTVSAQTHSGTDEVYNIAWEYDDETCTLTVSGEGVFPDHPSLADVPWGEYAHDVKILNMGEGFTSIETHAFETVYSDLEKVNLPDSLVSIGDQAFSNCDDLSEVNFGSGLQTIGKMAFQGAYLKKIKFPDSLKSIGSLAFDECTSLKTVNFGKGELTIGDHAFTDTAFKWITIPANVTKIGDEAFGFYYDVPGSDEDGESEGWFAREYFEIHTTKNTAAAKYATLRGFTLCTGAPSISPKSVSLKAGKTKKITVKNAAVTKWSTSNKKVALVKNGTVYALKKGSATITAKTLQGKKLTCKVKVTTNPTIKVNGKKFKASTRYTVKKGKTIKVTITGKSSAVKNAYSSTKKKIAKVISKTTAKTVKIKGYKKGGATVTIKVNGVAFKVKVKVK